MKHFVILFAVCFALTGFAQGFQHERVWATYFGDNSMRLADSKIDSEGNIYLVGSVDQVTFTDSHFSATPNAHQTSYGGGNLDGFLVKISPEGNLLWATYFGGENDDQVGAVSIGNNNSVFIIGRTGSTQNIAAPGAYQTNLNGVTDTFIAKFSSQGDRIWSTYYGGINEDGSSYAIINNSSPSNVTDGISTDDSGNVYCFNYTKSPDLGTPGVFQTTLNGERSYLISKFTDSGQRVWATYYGINKSRIGGIALSPTGLFVTGVSRDCLAFGPANTYFATPGCHKPDGNCSDVFLSKFSLDGNRVWSTYYGATSNESQVNNSVMVLDDFVYITAACSDYITSSASVATPGSFQEASPTENSFTSFLVKFDSEGVRQWGTFVGKNANVTGYIPTQSLSKDSLGNIFVSGFTYMSENISTSGSYQEEITWMNADSYVVKFSPNGERQWGTYYGGGINEYSGYVMHHNGDFYIVGMTGSTSNIATPGAFQSGYLNNSVVMNPASNIYIAKFSPSQLSTTTFDAFGMVLFPNPNNGSFNIKLPHDNEKYSLEVFDVLGQIVHHQKVVNDGEMIHLSNLKTGIYTVKLMSESQSSQIKKIIVR